MALARIQELLADIGPLPLVAVHRDEDDDAGWEVRDADGFMAFCGLLSATEAEFLAAAVNALPSLCEELALLRELRDAVLAKREARRALTAITAMNHHREMGGFERDVIAEEQHANAVSVARSREEAAIAACRKHREGTVPPVAPVCSTCNDTHEMSLGDRMVMCTNCPRPCTDCRQRHPGGGGGPYCSTTPCACSCHRAKKEGR